MKKKYILYGIGIILLILTGIVRSILLPSNACQRKQQGEDTIITPECLLQGRVPPVSFQESVDELRPEVVGFENVYISTSTTHTYTATQPIFATFYPPLVPETKQEIQDLRKASAQGKKILITKKQIAHYHLKNYSFYVADKDISQLKPCTKQNYLVALSSVDKKSIPQGAIYNLNKELQMFSGYCKGILQDQRMFYGGVCGVSSQLFRGSLIHPAMTILKRSPHNEWFTVYYGEQIQGDDAAMIEMRKQFEIQNTSSDTIYIRTKRFGEKTYVALISPYKIHDIVKISKTIDSPLSVYLTKEVFKKTRKGSLLQSTGSDSSLHENFLYRPIKKNIFSSLYINKNNENR